MTEAHSKWSASGFEAIMMCPGKKVLEANLPNTSSKYAAEGTAAHQVLTWALQEKVPAAGYIGRMISADGYDFVVDEDMAAHVQVCIDYVNDLAGPNGVILVDIRVNYSSYLDVPEAEAWGTADVIVLRDDEIMVVDFKYGMGVQVNAGENAPHGVNPNPQMALYGLGALQAYQDVAGEFARVRLAISQPRISVKPSEYDLTVAELEGWGISTARSAVNTCKNAMHVEGWSSQIAWEETFLRPNEKSCKFCRAKATCPALRGELVETTAGRAGAATPDEFLDVEPLPVTSASPMDWLEVMVEKADMFEDLLKAARAELERRLLAGETAKRHKLVEGKQGNRAWINEAEAEAALKSMRLKQEELYDFSVKSPTQIAKLGPQFDKDGKVKPVKEGAPAPVIGPRQWPKVLALITRAPAKKHVAPLSDPRPALVVTAVADEFETVSQPSAQAESFDLA